MHSFSFPPLQMLTACASSPCNLCRKAAAGRPAFASCRRRLLLFPSQNPGRPGPSRVQTAGSGEAGAGLVPSVATLFGRRREEASRDRGRNLRKRYSSAHAAHVSSATLPARRLVCGAVLCGREVGRGWESPPSLLKAWSSPSARLGRAGFYSRGSGALLAVKFPTGVHETQRGLCMGVYRLTFRTVNMLMLGNECLKGRNEHSVDWKVCVKVQCDES